MFQWMGYDVTKVNSNIVLGDALSNYSILCIPGGSPDVFAEDFGPNGLQNIRDFVEDGGLYIGFCAGAMLAGNKSTWNGQPDSYENLAIANTSTIGPINSYENPSMLSIALNSEHPAVGESQEELVLFAGGSHCTSGSGTETIGSYPNVKRAIISAQYGQGRAILFCVHPEFEEDSDLLDRLAPYLSAASRRGVKIAVRCYEPAEIEGCDVYLWKRRPEMELWKGEILCLAMDGSEVLISFLGNHQSKVTIFWIKNLFLSMLFHQGMSSGIIHGRLITGMDEGISAEKLLEETQNLTEKHFYTISQILLQRYL